MRPDMFKVIVERPRGGGGERHRDRSVDDENLPSHEGMSRPHKIRGRYKWLNENLKPLQRFLLRRVGRRWDDVYSEICANLRPQSTVQQHVRDHLDDFVNLHVHVAANGSLQSVPPLGESWGRYTRFFVDPRDGVLRSLPHRKRKALVKPLTHLVLAPEHELVKVKGIWYWVAFADVPAPVRKVRQVWSMKLRSMTEEESLIPIRVVDIVTGATVTHGRYRQARRQANSRDLRRHGLVNDSL